MSVRVISGKLKKKRLQSVQGFTTRPTSDRVKESLFNILGPEVQHAVVLDLFSGTGALGIEALSRGASVAIFIDQNNAAIKTIKHNIEACCLNDRASVIKWDITRNLNCIKTAKPAFTLVLMDPPYAKGTIRSTLVNLQACNALAGDALLVVEHSFEETIPEDADPFHLIDQRKYGDTRLSFLTFRETV